MSWFGETMFDVEISAGQLEGVTAERQLLCPHLLDILWRPAIAGGIGEVRAVFGEHRVDPVCHGCHDVTEKVTSDATRRLLVQFHKGELGSPVNRHQHAQLALFGPHFGQIDGK